MLDDTPLLHLLQDHLAPHVRWHNQRLRFLAAFLPALIQRFFAEATLPQRAVAAFVLYLLPTTERLVIATDRTEWHFGRTPINIFMASVVHDGTAFPLVWIMLGKAGSTSGAEQCALMRKLLLVVPPEQISVVLADREHADARSAI
ncbi:MAG: hypothetical protein AAF624_01045 [Bacteroidota bacterium]